MIRIAVDAMGGDFAPREVVHGSVIGAREYGVVHEQRTPFPGLGAVGGGAAAEFELAGEFRIPIDVGILTLGPVPIPWADPERQVPTRP